MTTIIGPKTVRLTWVEAGTRNAACLGFDEVIEIPAGEVVDVDDLRDGGEYHAQCAGLDIERYTLEIDVDTEV
jgi:hypothetical protein